MDLNFEVRISDEIGNREVPDLRQSVGWERRERDYPLLFERCLFWGSVRNELGKLIAFAYVTGPGLEHGYLEDVMVDCKKPTRERFLLLPLPFNINISDSMRNVDLPRVWAVCGLEAIICNY